MLIKCYYCEYKVEGELIFKHEEEDLDLDDFDNPGSYKYNISLLRCPNCNNLLLYWSVPSQKLGKSFLSYKMRRLWPYPEAEAPHHFIPGEIGVALMEARRCLEAEAYQSCAVMCRVVIEGVCKKSGLKEKKVVASLKELYEKEIIDKKIYEWSEMLRKQGNIGAHLSDEKIDKYAAKQLLDFATAICDYVFVLSKKYELFMKRTQLLEN